jgi:hypothetical protein
MILVAVNYTSVKELNTNIRWRFFRHSQYFYWMPVWMEHIVPDFKFSVNLPTIFSKDWSIIAALLPHPRRDIDHQTLDVAVDYGLQVLRDGLNGPPVLPR